MDLTFSPCDTQNCVDVAIVDDFRIEDDESFFVTLLWTLDLDSRINLDPVNEEIVILDNDSELNIEHLLTFTLSNTALPLQIEIFLTFALVNTVLHIYIIVNVSFPIQWLLLVWKELLTRLMRMKVQ